MQGLTIGVHHLRHVMYANFNWHVHNIGHAHVDMYAHFFPMIF